MSNVPPIPPTPRDRFRGCLLGGAVGDALGAPIEFDRYERIVEAFGPEGPADLAPGGHFTDDTQLTLWTADGLLRGQHRFNTKGIASLQGMVHRSYLRWLATQEPLSQRDVLYGPSGWLWEQRGLHHKRAPGGTCLSALRTGTLATARDPINNSKGCGGVMRAAPVGLQYAPEQAFKNGCESAALTHGHPSGYFAAGALAMAVALLREGATLDAALDRAEQRTRNEYWGRETADALAEARRLAATDLPDSQAIQALAIVNPPGGPGWVAEEALAVAALCALRYPTDFERAIRASVTHSGDSDSTGSICGNLLGTALGVDAIPVRWRESVEMADVVLQVADDLYDCGQGARGWEVRYPPA